MKNILAIINKPRGRGSSRHWDAFLFDTIVQSDVENFMMFVHHGDGSIPYFLADPDELERNEVGNMLYDGLWIHATDVHVFKKGVQYTYSIII